MRTPKYFFIIIFFTVCLNSCNNKSWQTKNVDWKKALLDTTFSDGSIKTIEFVQIEHPLLGGVKDTKTLSNKEKELLLLDLQKIKKYGLRKCADGFVIRIIFENDTLRLKTCSHYISNRFNDLYYYLPNNEDIIKKYWK